VKYRLGRGRVGVHPSGLRFSLREEFLEDEKYSGQAQIAFH